MVASERSAMVKHTGGKPVAGTEGKKLVQILIELFWEICFVQIKTNFAKPPQVRCLNLENFVNNPRNDTWQKMKKFE